MVLGILSAIAVAPALVGVTEGVRQGQRQNEREKHRGRKSNLIVTLPTRNSYSSTFDGSLVVLKNNKLYVDVSGASLRSATPAHPFAGYYLPYPGNETAWKTAGYRGEGMVSTISDDPPFLNWVYVHSLTYEVQYGVRADTEGHLVGPWDVTDTDKRVTFEGWEGFVAVQEDEEKEPDLWALYFDRGDDGLRTRAGMIGNKGKRMLVVELTRRERRKTREAAEEERVERAQKQQEMREKRERERAEKEGNSGDAGSDGQSQTDEMNVTPEEEIDE